MALSGAGTTDRAFRVARLERPVEGWWTLPARRPVAAEYWARLPAAAGFPGPISKIRPGGLAFNVVRAIGAVVARFVHTEEVTGSNPVSPTNELVRSADSAGRAILLFIVV